MRGGGGGGSWWVWWVTSTPLPNWTEHRSECLVYCTGPPQDIRVRKTPTRWELWRANYTPPARCHFRWTCSGRCSWCQTFSSPCQAGWAAPGPRRTLSPPTSGTPSLWSLDSTQTLGGRPSLRHHVWKWEREIRLRISWRREERGRAWQSSLKGQVKAIINQMYTGTISKATLGKLLRDGEEHIRAFPEHVDAILNWTGQTEDYWCEKHPQAAKRDGFYLPFLFWECMAAQLCVMRTAVACF